ncbi:MAG: hypothetical protein QXJ02_04310 [Candidatus Bathyarchaeia archaeon]
MGKVPENYLEFVLSYAPYAYVVPDSGPDLSTGKTSSAASLAIGFLCEAHGHSQFEAKRDIIANKVAELADWLLTQQCTDPFRLAYGGLKQYESSSNYQTIDACHAVPALLKAYELTGNAVYLAAAIRASLFLKNMQAKTSPSISNFFITDEGTLIEGFENAGEWTLSGSGATKEADTTNFKEGTQSLKLNTAAGGAAAQPA